MKSQILSILRQGIWASLTGGWFYDHNQTHFLNIFHLYSWLFLFSLPIVTYYCLKKFFPIVFTSFNSAWIFYCLLISTFFLTVKLFNQYLHYLFDKNKFKTDPNCKEKQKKNEKRNSTSNNKDLTEVQRLLTLFHENRAANESNNEVSNSTMMNWR